MKLSKKLLIGILSILPLSVFAHTQNITIEGDHSKLSAIMQTPDIKGNYPMVIIMHGFTSDKDFVLLEQIASKDNTISVNDIFGAMQSANNDYFNRTGNSAFAF